MERMKTGDLPSGGYVVTAKVVIDTNAIGRTFCASVGPSESDAASTGHGPGTTSAEVVSRFARIDRHQRGGQWWRR
jgi:hypothetical protein